MTPAIVGIGRTAFTSGADVSAAALAAQAILAALDDAGLRLEDLEGVVRFDREALWEYDLPGVMRLALLPSYGAVPDGPGSAPALVRLAAMAVRTRAARAVVGYHARSAPRPAVPAEVLAAAGCAAAPASAAATQGGCAFVVRAVAPADRGVRIPASAQAAVPSAARHLAAWQASRRDGVLARAARGLFADAGLEPAAVDVACLYDQPSGLVRLTLADFGLEAARAVVNPHAGGPDAGALDGIDDLLEAVRQLRGAARRQVPGARIALVAASPLEPTSALLLEAGP